MSAVEMIERLKTHLVELKFASALEILDQTIEQIEQIERNELSAVEALERLLNQEHSSRESRRIRSQLRTSRLLQNKTLDTFDFAFQPTLDRQRVMALAELAFIDRNQSVHLLGPPGVGKTHLASALGILAVKARKAVYFTTLADLISSLTKAEREGSLNHRLRYINRASLVIIDEVGYLPIEKNGANLFFQLVNARYEKGATILPRIEASKNGVRFSATTSSQRHCSIVCCIAPRYWRLPATLIDCASMPTLCRTNSSVAVLKPRRQ